MAAAGGDNARPPSGGGRQQQLRQRRRGTTTTRRTHRNEEAAAGGDDEGACPGSEKGLKIKVEFASGQWLATATATEFSQTMGVQCEDRPAVGPPTSPPRHGGRRKPRSDEERGRSTQRLPSSAT